jgi:micrococcal nuclease
MNKIFQITLAFLVFLSLQVLSQSKETNSISRIIDGDSVRVNTINDYRLAGIDAPEKDQPFGEEAGKRLKELLDGNELAGLLCLPKSDKYGRDICIISLWTASGEKIDPAEELVKEGLAEVEYARFLPPSTERIYKQAEKEAKEKKLGIWSQKNYIKPSDWRKMKK